MTALLVLACATLAIGMALVISWAAARRPSLDARIARYVRPADGGAWVTHASGPRFAPARLAAPVVRDLGRVLERWGSSAADVRPDSTVRARRSRWSNSARSRWRGERSASPEASRPRPCCEWRGALRSSRCLIIVGVCAIGAALARDAWLTHAAHKRTERIIAELPTIADLLALSVAAGEGARSALERVARTTSGALPHELRRALTDARSGEPLSRALQDMALRTRAQPLRRFVDGIVAALDLGTPLAGVLRAQAHDARVAGREQLMEQGGKREIAMLVPVVFLILPVTIVFAKGK